MTHRKHCVMIEGFPKCFGTAKPDFYEGELSETLCNPNSIKLSQEITPFGGISKCNDLNFTLNDTDNELSKYFQFFNPISSSILTRPLTAVTTTVSLSTSLHGYKKSFANTQSNKGMYTENEAFLCKSAFTIAIRLKTGTGAGSGIRFFYHTQNSTASNRISFYSHNGYINSYWNPTGNYITANPSIQDNTDYWIFLKNDGGKGGIYCYNIATDTMVSSEENQAIPGLQDSAYILGRNIINYGCTWAIYKSRFYSECLSQAQIESICDGDEIVAELNFESDMNPYNGANIHDQSGNSNHLNIISGMAWTARPLIERDELYLPRSTWRVTALSGAIATVEQGIYSSMSAAGSYYYDKHPRDDYTCKVYYDYPGQYNQRQVCYYRDDGDGLKLMWVGMLQGLAQRGRGWTFTAKHVLSLMSMSLKPGGGFIPIDHTYGKHWQVPHVTINYQKDGSEDVHGQVWTPPAREFFTREYLVSRYRDYPNGESTAPNGIPFWHTSTKYGLGAYSKKLQTLVEKPANFGTHGAFFDTKYQTVNSDDVNHQSSNFPMKKYGLILGQDFEFATVEDSSTLLGTYVVQDGYYWRIKAVSTTTDADGHLIYYCKVEGAWDKDFNHCSERTTGISSNTPISLQKTSVVDVDRLSDLYYAMLISTGCNQHGLLDELDGHMALGLDECYIDDTVAIGGKQLKPQPIDGNEISQELEALGYALIFEDEKFRLKRILPPIVQMAVADVVDGDLEAGKQVNLDWGYYRPLSSIKYINKDNEYTMSVNDIQLFGNTAQNGQEWTSSLNYEIEDIEAFMNLQYRRLQWCQNYKPTAVFAIPHGSDAGLGDVLTLSLVQCAGEKWYGIASMPALVISVGDNNIYRVVLNTSPAANRAAWAIGWQIVSYSGAVLTVKGSTKWLDDNDFPDSAACRVYLGDGTTNLTTTVLSHTASTITLNAAPTFNMSTHLGYISFVDHDSYAQSIQDAWVWASNNSGVMVDGDAGKVLY